MNSAVELCSLTQEDCLATGELIGSVFVDHEPLTLCVPMTVPEFAEWSLKRVVMPSLPQNLSILAKIDGNIVGFFCCEDLALHQLESEDDAVDTFIVSILRWYLSVSPQPLPRGRSIYLNFLGVAQQAQGRGIALKLATRVLQIAKERGFEYAFAISTSTGSQQLFAKLGFRQVHEVVYADFVYPPSGERTFAQIRNPPSCKVGKYLQEDEHLSV